MTCPFLDELHEKGILADGAIGTEIYRRGIFFNRSFDELNLSSPDLIRKIHEDYFNAGSRLLKTNTFMANRASLAQYGFEAKMEEINQKGVSLARGVAGSVAFVAGSVGPISSSVKLGDYEGELEALFKEQLTVLATSGVDVFLLETFTNLDELDLAVKVAKKVADLPVVAQVSLNRLNDEEYAGFTPEAVIARMAETGADVVGVNCSDGPQGVFEALKRIAPATKKPLSAMPNAGMPKVMQGRTFYLVTPEYMAEYARRFAQLGVALIGGCCGTTPAHIKEMKKFLQSVRPQVRVEVLESRQVLEEYKGIEPLPIAKRSGFGALLGHKFAISVELEPPLGTNPEEAVHGAEFLKSLGVDAVNIADGPRAIPRMSPIALAAIIKEKKVPIETIVHYCCRDRNILGMQMDLLGSSALGLNNLMLITGDPPKMGRYPDATAVFDLDAIGLIKFVSNMNRALDFANQPLKAATSFVIGCGCNPGAVDIDIEADRLRQKVAAGAEFIFSQPVYDLKTLEKFLDKTKEVASIPFFVGILPLASLKNAEFLHNEVPGMQVPDVLMNRMRAETTREGQRSVGVAVAREMFQYAKKLERAKGAYIFPPFGNYKLIEKVIKE